MSQAGGARRDVRWRGVHIGPARRVCRIAGHPGSRRPCAYRCPTATGVGVGADVRADARGVARGAHRSTRRRPVRPGAPRRSVAGGRARGCRTCVGIRRCRAGAQRCGRCGRCRSYRPGPCVVVRRSLPRAPYRKRRALRHARHDRGAQDVAIRNGRAGQEHDHWTRSAGAHQRPRAVCARPYHRSEPRRGAGIGPAESGSQRGGTAVGWRRGPVHGPRGRAGGCPMGFTVRASRRMPRGQHQGRRRPRQRSS